MRHKGLTVVRAPASSIEDAHEIVGRLTQAGFARNSIDVDRHGENRFEISLHVREANRARAQKAIDNAVGGNWGIGISNTTVVWLVGGAAALAAGLIALRSTNALSASLPWLQRQSAGADHGKRHQARPHRR